VLNVMGIKLRPQDLELTAEFDEYKTESLIRQLKGKQRKLDRLLDRQAISESQYDRQWEREQEKIDRLEEGLDVNGNPRLGGAQ
jgi:hypothetical protein